MTIEVGDLAPDFELMDQDRNPVRLSSFQGSKNVVVVFYPLAFTPTCQGELCTIRDSIADFSSDDVQTLAISCDSGPSLARWATEQGYTALLDEVYRTGQPFLARSASMVRPTSRGSRTTCASSTSSTSPSGGRRGTSTESSASART